MLAMLIVEIVYHYCGKRSNNRVSRCCRTDEVNSLYECVLTPVLTVMCSAIVSINGNVSTHKVM
jgi:hypothetical protein